MKAYHIKQWDSLYETAVTRKIRTLTFYAKPNKLVGEGIGATLAQEDNAALLGTWVLIESLASTAPHGQRGWLVRNGTALTPARMAALTRVKPEHFERALVFFCLPEVDWLEFVEMPGESPGEPSGKTKSGPEQESAGTKSSRESEQGNNREEPRVNSPSASIPTVDEARTWAVENSVDPHCASKLIVRPYFLIIG